ncbi:MAG: prepilin peptidase [Fidelibacterota bacterium]
MVTVIGILAVGAVFAIVSNSVIDRIPQSQSVIWPGPYCRSCAATLTWKDIIPLYSYIRSRGKCPYCGSPIPVRNLVVEVAEISWVALFVIKFGWSYQALLELMFGMGLIAVIVIQLESRRLSDLVLLLLGMLTLIYLLAFKSEGVPMSIASLGMGGGLLLLYNLLSVVSGARSRMEVAEIKLGAILGLFLGYPYVLLCIFLAVFGGASLASFRIKFQKVDVRESIPEFAVIMATAGLVTVLFGQDLMALYRLIIGVA